jgi:hypothetical protein
VEEENTSAQTSTISRRGAPQADKFGNGNGLGDIFAVRLAVTMSIGPLVLTNIGPPPVSDLLSWT